MFGVFKENKEKSEAEFDKLQINISEKIFDKNGNELEICLQPPQYKTSQFI